MNNEPIIPTPIHYCNECGKKNEGFLMAPGPYVCMECSEKKTEEINRLEAANFKFDYDINEILISDTFYLEMQNSLPDALDEIDDLCYEEELIIRAVSELQAIIGNGISSFVFNQNFSELDRVIKALEKLGDSDTLKALKELEIILKKYHSPERIEDRMNYFDNINPELNSIMEAEIYELCDKYASVYDDMKPIEQAKSLLEKSREKLKSRKI